MKYSVQSRHDDGCIWWSCCIVVATDATSLGNFNLLHNLLISAIYTPKMTGSMSILLLVAILQVAVAFTASRSSLRNVRNSLNMVQKEAFQLVLLRHGESSWNKENKFTGWYDCPLSEKGHAEAAAAGALLQEEGNTDLHKTFFKLKWLNPNLNPLPVAVHKNVRFRFRRCLHLLPKESNQNSLAHSWTNWTDVYPNHQRMAAQREVGTFFSSPPSDTWNCFLHISAMSLSR